MFSLPGVVAALIEDARRRQHRRRRGVAAVALGLAVLAGAGFFGSRQFGAHRHAAVSANAAKSPSFTYVTEQGADGFTIRRVMPIASGAQRHGPFTVVSGVTLGQKPNASVTVELNPQTGAIEVHTVRTARPR